jgi:hypothetical protein
MRAGQVIAKLAEDAYFMRVDNRVGQAPPVRNRDNEATSRSADIGRNRTRADLPANPNRTRAIAGGPSQGGNSAGADREIVSHRDPGSGGSNGWSSNHGANRRAGGGGDRSGRGHTDSHVSGASRGGFDARQKIEELWRKKASTAGDMITSWADEEDKANAKYDAIRGKSKQNTGGDSSNNGNQGGRSNNYSGPNRKRKPDNTAAAIQRPAKENSKKTSGGFKDLLKEKCLWHLDDNHTTEQCYQLRRALRDTPEPRHPHDKKGKKKTDEGNDDFQEPDKTVNILFGGLPNRRAQKATR